jgi:hypothetical protein
MRIVSALAVVVFLCGLLTFFHAGRNAQATNRNEVDKRVIASLGEEFAIEFNRDGDTLANPSKAKKAEAKTLSVKVELGVTTDSPFPPPRDGATRPFLSIENNFEKSLRCRVMVRMKGSKEYVEMSDEVSPILAGETSYKCWDFDTEVEEISLDEFSLTDKSGT